MGPDRPIQFQAVQGWIERALLHLQHSSESRWMVWAMAYPWRAPCCRAWRTRRIQGTLQERRGGQSHMRDSPYDDLGKCCRRSLQSKGNGSMWALGPGTSERPLDSGFRCSHPDGSVLLGTWSRLLGNDLQDAFLRIPQTVSGTAAPTSFSVKSRCKSSISAVAWLSNTTMISPSCNPGRLSGAAGLDRHDKDAALHRKCVKAGDATRQGNGLARNPDVSTANLAVSYQPCCYELSSVTPMAKRSALRPGSRPYSRRSPRRASRPAARRSCRG